MKQPIILLISGVITFFAGTATSFAAENLTMITGAFARTVTYAEIEAFAKTGKPEGFLADILKRSGLEYSEAQAAITAEIEIDVLEINDLMTGEFGNMLLDTIGNVIAPRRSNKYGKQALRSALILSAEDSVMTPLEIIKKYPTDIRINIVQALELADELDQLLLSR